MDPDTQRTLITAGTTILAALVGGLLVLRAETSRNRRTLEAQKHYDRQSLLIQLASTLYAAEFQLALSHSEAHKYKLFFDQGRKSLDERMAAIARLEAQKKTDEAHKKLFDLTMEDFFQDSREFRKGWEAPLHRAMDLIAEYQKSQREAMQLAAQYQSYPSELSSIASRRPIADVFAVFRLHALAMNKRDASIVSTLLIALAEDLVALSLYERDLGVFIQASRRRQLRPNRQNLTLLPELDEAIRLAKERYEAMPTVGTSDQGD